MESTDFIKKYIEKITDNKLLSVDTNQIINSTRTLISFLLPGRFCAIKETLGLSTESEIKKSVNLLGQQISLSNQSFDQDKFFSEYLNLFDLIELDIKAALKNDPAARTSLEVAISYPGILAVSAYRIANTLHRLNVSIIPRIITEWAHKETGIDIHFGAQIGDSFFIDHGSGVVIGETTVIGNNVTIYQGVTLGSKNFPLDEDGTVIKGLKRHPTIGDNVTIYANSTILGGDTVIGNNTTIAGNLFVTKSIPENSIALLKGVFKK